jgi:hypothetical protein
MRTTLLCFVFVATATLAAANYVTVSTLDGGLVSTQGLNVIYVYGDAATKGVLTYTSSASEVAGSSRLFGSAR